MALNAHQNGRYGGADMAVRDVHPIKIGTMDFQYRDADESCQKTGHRALIHCTGGVPGRHEINDTQELNTSSCAVIQARLVRGLVESNGQMLSRLL